MNYGFNPAVNQNFQYAMNSVPFAGGMSAPQVQQQAPINFAGGEEVQIPEEKKGFSLGKILLLAGATVAAVGAHKTYQLGKEFKALQEGSKIAKEAEYKFGANFLHNCNPVNWFGNAKTAEALGKSEGFTKLGETGKFFQKGNDVFQVSGKNVRSLDGKLSEEVTEIANKAKNVEGEVKPEVKPEVTPKVELTKEERILANQYKNIKTENAKIQEAMSKITDKNSVEYTSLKEKLSKNIETLKSDEMVAIKTKVKEIKVQNTKPSTEPVTLVNAEGKSMTIHTPESRKANLEKVKKQQLANPNSSFDTKKFEDETKKVIDETVKKETSLVAGKNTKNIKAHEVIDAKITEFEKEIATLQKRTGMSLQIRDLQDKIATLENLKKIQYPVKAK